MPERRPFTERFTERFWGKVNKVNPNGCWIWQGSKDRLGYGRVGGSKSGEGRGLAHRFAYEFVKGPIPEGLELDHLCRNPPCVNPDHLEAVSHLVNTLRGIAGVMAARTHCLRGHPYDLFNTYYYGLNKTKRQCRICRTEQEQKRLPRHR